MQVGQYSDQTYQQYILKALGELVLYVDGMHGLIQCNEIIQWLYELTRSKVHTHTPCMQYRDREVSLSLQYRAVVKATLDLLIVFVDYSEPDSGHGTPNHLPAGSASPSGSGEPLTHLTPSHPHSLSLQLGHTLPMASPPQLFCSKMQWR